MPEGEKKTQICWLFLPYFTDYYLFADVFCTLFFYSYIPGI